MATSSVLRGAAHIAATALPGKPRLAPWLTFVDLGDGRLQLRATDFAFTIPAGLFAEAARVIGPLVDGTRTVEELSAAVAPRYLPGTVIFLLQLFRQRGVLQEGEPTPPLPPEVRLRHGSALQLFSHYVADAEQVLLRLAQSRVALAGTASVCARLEAALVSLGVGNVAVDSADPADLVIAASDTAGTAFFASVNSACLESGARWLRVAFEGRLGIVGPTIVPGQTACFTCYGLRRAMHDVWPDFQAHRDKLLHDGDPHEGAIEALTDVVVAQAALEAARLITAFAPPATFGRFYAFNAASPLVAGHDVLRVPRCPDCGRKQSPRDPWDTRSR
jgi:bacteriocin biosynthesis cyclodehydratase domain-containing protein